GYHLILVEKIAPPQYELIRKSLVYDIARERFNALIASAVQLNPDYFKK
ncbi:MAG: hypothetical protein HY821_17685, partial [Acidobacteria bacterium]|nr:hypothetical protein [Acidobacteriota bacterium]